MTEMTPAEAVYFAAAALPAEVRAGYLQRACAGNDDLRRQVERTQPNAWTTFNTQSLLGGALIGQENYAEAEPLLLAGFEGMKEREETIPRGGETRIPEALDRLIELYSVMDKPDELKKWRTERAKYPQADQPPEQE